MQYQCSQLLHNSDAQEGPDTMTLKECYSLLEGDYNGVMSRLMREALVSRFLQVRPEDKEYNNLHDALNANDFATAFRAVHTMKGTCLNLGLTKLADAASDLTEALRDGEPKGDYLSLLAKLDKTYSENVEIIRSFALNPEIK